mmetsp:Transcript_13961/g.26140  ORF Transcript_13961/g.26140 Transcript_13961/m.26140 type:complete len:146 (+) Transcript_13961:2454-2891(+)
MPRFSTSPLATGIPHQSLPCLECLMGMKSSTRTSVLGISHLSQRCRKCSVAPAPSIRIFVPGILNSHFPWQILQQTCLFSLHVQIKELPHHQTGVSHVLKKNCLLICGRMNLFPVLLPFFLACFPGNSGGGSVCSQLRAFYLVKK